MNEITYCVGCGARFEEEVGWIDEHAILCVNRRYGWLWTTKNKPWSVKMTYKEEIQKQMEVLPDNARIIGYNVRYGSQAYGTLLNVSVSKIIETPVAENLMVGMAIGMALEGYLPIVWFERHDFILNGLDAIINHLDKIEELSRGEFNPKVIIRACVGGQKPIYPGLQHVQNYTYALEKMVRNMNVFMCHNASDIPSIWNKALNDINSSIIIEWRDKYETVS